MRREYSVEINLHNYGQLIFDRDWGNSKGKIIFSTKGTGTTGYPHANENEVSLHTY